VWLDKDEIAFGVSAESEMKAGICKASVFVICLTPLYLTRHNCLKELHWALEICDKDPMKHIVVIPLHLSVNLIGFKTIFERASKNLPAHVFLPVLSPSGNKKICCHKLSGHALVLMSRLMKKTFDDSCDWLKLQPWMSDLQGEDWEEVSREWGCEKSASMQILTDNLVCKMRGLIGRDLCVVPESSCDKLADSDLESATSSLSPSSASDSRMPIEFTHCFPRSSFLFSELDVVELACIGLSDDDIMGCIEHGYGPMSFVDDLITNPLHSAVRIAAHMSGVNFEAARRKLQNIHDTFQQSRQFLSDLELFAIISCPVEMTIYGSSRDPSNSSSFHQALSDGEIYDCIKVGKKLVTTDSINCVLNLNQVILGAYHKFVDSCRLRFDDIFAGRAPGSDSPAVFPSFSRWLSEQLDTHVVCRVEGTDDVLFVNALFERSGFFSRENAAECWNDFLYKQRSKEKGAEMKIRANKLSRAQLNEARERVGVFEGSFDGDIEQVYVGIRRVFSKCNVVLADIVDSDLKAPVQTILQKPSSVFQHRWRWGRAIENYLLPVSAPAAALITKTAEAHKLFLEVFEKISLNFLRSAGDGWLGWQKLSHNEAKGPTYGPMKKFIQDLIEQLFTSRPDIAPDMLVMYELFREVGSLVESESIPPDEWVCALKKYEEAISHLSGSKHAVWVACAHKDGAKFDISAARVHAKMLLNSVNTKTPTSSDRKGQSEPAEAEKSIEREFRERHKSESFWFPFPRFLFFLTKLCWMQTKVPECIRKISESCALAIFNVLCALLFDLPADTILGSSLLCASNCRGFLPCNIGTERQRNFVCVMCRRPACEHVLQHTGKPLRDMPVEFLKLICRVGSIGWAPHEFMKIIHGTENLGRKFAEEFIVHSQHLYRQHLQLHVFTQDTPIAEGCKHCSLMTVLDDELPPEVVAANSKLQQQRSAELSEFLSRMGSFFCGGSASLESTTRSSSLSPLSPLSPMTQFPGAPSRHDA
jgi:hypothetical protein